MTRATFLDRWLIDNPSVPGDSNQMHSLFHRQPLLLLVIATVIGILVDDACGENLRGPVLIAWIAMVVVCIVGLLTSMWNRSGPTGRRLGTLGVCVLVMSVSGINHRWHDQTYASASILGLVGSQPSPAIVQGVVTSTPTLRVNAFGFRDRPQSRRLDQNKNDAGQAADLWTTSFVMAAQQFRVGQEFVPTDGNLLVFVDGRCDDLLPGDSITAYGTAGRAGQASNPGGRDPVASARRRNIHAHMNLASVDQIERRSVTQTHWIGHRVIAKIAERGRDILLEQLGETSGPLAVALVLGQRDFVNPDQRDQLLITGTAHLLSVSGMHLAIVVSMASFLAALLRFPFVWKVVFTIAVCVFYTALTGGRPPVLRAAILVTTFTIAIWMRRPSQPMNTLSLAGLLLLFLNPENLFSVGVHLSFLAVATLLLSSGRLKPRVQSKSVDMALDHEERLNALAESSRSRPVYFARLLVQAVISLFWFSLCVTAVAAPLVWHQFHVISFISVAANVILGPLLFLALGSGLVTVIASWIDPRLGWPAAMLCHGSIGTMQWIIAMAASIPWGHVWLPSPPTAWVFTFYAVLVASLLIRRSIASRCIRSVWIAVWMIISYGLATAPAELPDQAVELTFVDVGHGTCVVIRSDQQTCLYDCGRLGNDTGNSRDIDQVLWSLGVSRIDAVVLSHADSDHFNALPGILRRFAVGEIVTPPGMLDEPESALSPIVEAIARHRVPSRELSVGDTLGKTDMLMQVLHPPATRIAGSDNANSLVVRLDHGGRVILLPGDLESPGTEQLVDADRLPAGGVMMAPHHGSLAMDADVILQWARPAETIVSGGRLAERPEVSSMLSQRGSRVHVTAISGAIRVRVSASGQIEVRTWLDSPW